MFVALVAKAVGGEYPEQFSSRLHSEIRLVIGGSTILYTAVALYSESTILTQDLRNTSTIEDVVLLVFTIVIFLAIYSIANRRRRSIEKHALQTTLEEISKDDQSLESTTDAITLYDYFKVFFALALLFFIPDAALVIWPQSTIIRNATIVTFPLHMYYFLLVIDSGAVLGGRWAKKYVNNDKTKTSSGSSTNS